MRPGRFGEQRAGDNGLSVFFAVVASATTGIIAKRSGRKGQDAFFARKHRGDGRGARLEESFISAAEVLYWPQSGKFGIISEEARRDNLTLDDGAGLVISRYPTDAGPVEVVAYGDLSATVVLRSNEPL